MARRKRRPPIIKASGKSVKGTSEVNEELPIAPQKPLKAKKVVKTIHFDQSDVEGLTSRAEALGLTFSSYLRMIAKKDLMSGQMR